MNNNGDFSKNNIVLGPSPYVVGGVAPPQYGQQSAMVVTQQPGN